MKVVITNHTGARNRGCEALVLSKILGIKRVLGNVDIDIIGHDPLYDSWRFGDHAVSKYSYLTKTPEHTSSLIANKIFYLGASVVEHLPIGSALGLDFGLRQSLKSADIIVPSGGDIFTSDYNNIRKHLSILVSAPKGAKIYLCSHTIGPLKAKDEDYFKKVISKASLISVRESESYEYLSSLGLDLPLHLTADVAFTLPALDRESSKSLLKEKYGLDPDKKPLVALSISEGIIKYSGLDKSNYYNQFSGLVDYLNKKGYSCVLIPHVMEVNPTNNDVIACEQVMNRVNAPAENRIIFGEPSAVELKGVIGLCDVLVGTRTHATIASLSQCIPTVSIAYSRKAYGIMRDIFGESLGASLTVPAEKVTADNLIESFELAKTSNPSLDKISEIKKMAHKNFELINTIVD